MDVPRRRVLKWSLGGVAAGGLGLGLWRLRGDASKVEGFRALSAHEYRTVQAIANAVIPRGGPFEKGAADRDMARLFDGFLADEPPENVSDLKTAILLVEFGPLLYERRWATFSGLDEAARRAHWERWETAKSAVRRQVAVAFRKFVTMVFYDDAEVWPHIGYDENAPELPSP